MATREAEDDHYLKSGGVESGDSSNPMTALSKLLLQAEASAAFQPSVLGRRPSPSNSRYAATHPVVMSETYMASAEDEDLSEFTAEPETEVGIKLREAGIEIGDTIKCRVMKVDMEKGKTRFGKDRPLLLVSHSSKPPFDGLMIGDEVEGVVKELMPVGAFVDIGRKKMALLPTGQICSEYIAHPAERLLLGDHVKCRVLNLQESRCSLIMKEGRPLSEIRVGEDLEGIVRCVKPDWAYVDVGAEIDGHLLATDMPFEFGDDLTQKLMVGDALTVRIKGVHDNREKGRRKKLLLTCLDETPKYVDEKLVGKEVEGRIARVERGYALVDIGDNVLATLPYSLLPDDEGDYVENVWEKLRVGDDIRCRVKLVDLAKQRVYLTCRDEVETEGRPAHEFKVGDEVEGTVKQVVDIGVFVDIGAKNRAILHRSQMENTINRPKEKYSVGDSIKCYIKKVDVHREKIELTTRDDLGGKPVDKFKVGDEVEGTIKKVKSEKAFVDIGATRDALLPESQFRKHGIGESNNLTELLKEGDSIKCRIMSANPNIKHILLSCLEQTPLDQLTPRQEVEGTVVYAEPDFIRVDIGAVVDAQLYHWAASEKSTEMNPQEQLDMTTAYKVGDRITCRILLVNLHNLQVWLTLKEVTGGLHTAKFRRGQEFMGKVKAEAEHGVWVDVGSIEYAYLPSDQI